jgi:hypothetical protein
LEHRERPQYFIVNRRRSPMTPTNQWILGPLLLICHIRAGKPSVSGTPSVLVFGRMFDRAYLLPWIVAAETATIIESDLI